MIQAINSKMYLTKALMAKSPERCGPLSHQPQRGTHQEENIPKKKQIYYVTYLRTCLQCGLSDTTKVKVKHTNTNQISI